MHSDSSAAIELDRVAAVIVTVNDVNDAPSQRRPPGAQPQWQSNLGPGPYGSSDDAAARAGSAAAVREIQKSKNVDRAIQLVSGLLSIIAIILIGVTKTDIDAANNKIGLLNLNLAASQAQLVGVQATLATLNADALQRQFSSLNNTASILNVTTSQEQVKLTQIQTDIAAIGNVPQRFSNLEAGASAVQSRVSTLESANVSASTRISALETANSTIQSRITSVEATTANLSPRMMSMEDFRTAIEPYNSARFLVVYQSQAMSQPANEGTFVIPNGLENLIPGMTTTFALSRPALVHVFAFAQVTTANVGSAPTTLFVNINGISLSVQNPRFDPSAASPLISPAGFAFMARCLPAGPSHTVELKVACGNAVAAAASIKGGTMFVQILPGNVTCS